MPERAAALYVLQELVLEKHSPPHTHPSDPCSSEDPGKKSSWTAMGLVEGRGSEDGGSYRGINGDRNK